MRQSLLTLACLVLLPCAPAAAIVGGKDAPAGTYDAVANVAIAGTGSCGGTLIAASWVLSAGHCGSITGGLIGTPIGWPPGAVQVTLGTTRTDGTGGRRISVDRVVLSPAYLATSGNDVSLLHLATPAAPTPVRIAGARGADIWKTGVTSTIAGFGTTREGGETPASMQVAEVPIVADSTCASTYPSSFESRTQLCAGYPQGGTDTCQGDSGGPLLARDGAGVQKLVGVTSYGDGCAQPGKYGIYARVAGSALREWIRATVPSAIDDDATADAPPPAATPPPPPPAAAAAALKLVRLRALKAGGMRLTLVVSLKGRLTLRWKAGAKRGTRTATLSAGQRSLLLAIPRRSRSAYVSATLTPSAGARAVTASKLLRVAR